MAQPKKRPAKGKRPPNGREDVGEEKKAPGKFQKAFFWVIIPLLFASAILLIVFQVTGTNVFEKAKELTGISQSDDVSKVNNKNYEDQLVSLKSQLQEKEAEIKGLQDQIDQQKTDAKKERIEKRRLKKEIKKLKSDSKDEMTNTSIETLVATYEQMRPKSAAPALVALKVEEAVAIMSKLKTETLAAILEKMSPDDAARFTTLLSAKKTDNKDETKNTTN